LRKRMLATWTPDQELNHVRLRSGADMKRKLQWYDLIALGVGGMLGVGVFVTTGRVANSMAGPSVFISYIIAGVSALLSSLCYTEFSVQIPVAGGAFSYLRVTFGEFVGYFAGANILMEYVLSNAAVARNFTDYLCRALGENDATCWRIEVEGLMKGYNMLDFPAVALVLLLTLCLCRILVFFFSIKIHAKYRRLLLTRDLLDLPATLTSVKLRFSLFLKTLISKDASFSVAFEKIGWGWASNLVGAGASLGIVASLVVAMLGQARYLCVIGRSHLVPSWLAKVHPSTGTPLNATLFLGICTALIALFTDLEIVFELISLGTLMVFYLVANALIYRRHVITSCRPPLHTILFLFLLSSASLGFSVSWKLEKWWGSALFSSLAAITTASFHRMVPFHGGGDLQWSVPLMPWPASASIFLNIFLMTRLKAISFRRFGIWACVISLFYVLYGVHSTYEAEETEKEAGSDGIVNTISSSSIQQ
ncbi:hypothetical protein EUGRSUZ_D02134, partial [Eucalyptus grandis]